MTKTNKITKRIEELLKEMRKELSFEENYRTMTDEEVLLKVYNSAIDEVIGKMKIDFEDELKQFQEFLKTKFSSESIFYNFITQLEYEQNDRIKNLTNLKASITCESEEKE